MVKYPMFKWKISGICLNPNIDWNIVKKYNKFPWSYKILSMNSNITWNIVLDNIDKEWCYKNLSMNSNITWNIIENNPLYEWDYNYFLYNKNLNLEALEKIIYNKNIPYKLQIVILEHDFNEDKNKYITNCYKKWFHDNVLQDILNLNFMDYNI